MSFVRKEIDMNSRKMRNILAMVIALILSFGGAALAAEWGVDRPGGDYKNFDLPTDQPSLCEQACNSEAQCKAWTFVRPGVQGPNARCWLKSSVPSPNNNDCCVSGVKQASAGSFEQDRNRPGMDYKDFDLPQLHRRYVGRLAIRKRNAVLGPM